MIYFIRYNSSIQENLEMQKIISIASVLCGERITQRELSEILGVTEVTIRNHYKEPTHKLDIGF